MTHMTQKLIFNICEERKKMNYHDICYIKIIIKKQTLLFIYNMNYIEII